MAHSHTAFLSIPSTFHVLIHVISFFSAAWPRRAFTRSSIFLFQIGVASSNLLSFVIFLFSKRCRVGGPFAFGFSLVACRRLLVAPQNSRGRLVSTHHALLLHFPHSRSTLRSEESSHGSAPRVWNTRQLDCMSRARRAAAGPKCHCLITTYNSVSSAGRILWTNYQRHHQASRVRVTYTLFSMMSRAALHSRQSHDRRAVPALGPHLRPFQPDIAHVENAAASPQPPRYSVWAVIAKMDTECMSNVHIDITYTIFPHIMEIYSQIQKKKSTKIEEL